MIYVAMASGFSLIIITWLALLGKVNVRTALVGSFLFLLYSMALIGVHKDLKKYNAGVVATLRALSGNVNAPQKDDNKEEE